jgi:predicted RNA binding protein YcfA (HicA-like mRNA interferase family)
MPPLPTVSGREAVRVFVSLGWSVARQSGSHIILTRPGQIATLSVPDHPAVAKGTLRALLRSAQINVDDFVRACDQL